MRWAGPRRSRASSNWRATASCADRSPRCRSTYARWSATRLGETASFGKTPSRPISTRSPSFGPLPPAGPTLFRPGEEATFQIPGLMTIKGQRAPDRLGRARETGRRHDHRHGDGPGEADRLRAGAAAPGDLERRGRDDLADRPGGRAGAVIARTTCDGRPGLGAADAAGGDGAVAERGRPGRRGALLLDHWGADGGSDRGDDYLSSLPRNRSSQQSFLDGVPQAFPIYGEPSFKEPCLARGVRGWHPDRAAGAHGRRDLRARTATRP